MLAGAVLEEKIREQGRDASTITALIDKANCAITDMGTPADEKLALYAWVGKDERGGGRVGIKQALVPAGYIALVAMDYDLHKIAGLLSAMECQARIYGKKIRLCKFTMTEVAAETKAGA